MLNDLIVLMYGLKKRTFDAVLRDFKLKPHDKEKFLNSLEIIKELRNACAHFELITVLAQNRFHEM
jgi:abortive infection bacteriophage resistance protein